MRRVIARPALRFLLFSAAAIALIGCGGSDREDQLLVFGATSLDTAISEYAESFNADTDAVVRTSFAGSDQLAAQIRQGAAADVYASADLEFPARLHAEGLVEEPRAFASNSLVIAVPTESSIRALADLEEPGVDIVIGDVSVPVGAYTRAALDQLPAAESEAIFSNVRSEEPDVASAVAKLIQGAADAAIVYSTDAAAAGEQVKAIPLPEPLQPEIIYAAAVVSESNAPDLAGEFIQGLIDGEGATSLREAGFLPPPP